MTPRSARIEARSGDHRSRPDRNEFDVDALRHHVDPIFRHAVPSRHRCPGGPGDLDRVHPREREPLQPFLGRMAADPFVECRQDPEGCPDAAQSCKLPAGEERRVGVERDQQVRPSTGKQAGRQDGHPRSQGYAGEVTRPELPARLIDRPAPIVFRPGGEPCLEVQASPTGDGVEPADNIRCWDVVPIDDPRPSRASGPGSSHRRATRSVLPERNSRTSAAPPSRMRIGLTGCSRPVGATSADSRIDPKPDEAAIRRRSAGVK